MKQLSVIVPVYHVEKYIRPCIESIFKQGLKEETFEVIIVNDGTQDLQIVCGASNVHTGLIGVLAPVGCVLPGAKKPIGQRTVAGTESFGMMCSAAELGIGDNSDEIVELDSDAKIGEKYKG